MNKQTEEEERKKNDKQIHNGYHVALLSETDLLCMCISDRENVLAGTTEYSKNLLFSFRF